MGSKNHSKSSQTKQLFFISSFLIFHTVHFFVFFINNQQMHWFLAVYYFILPLLHVSTRVCHHPGDLLCLLCYMRIECMIDKTLRYRLLCVCYVDAWYAPIGAYQASIVERSYDDSICIITNSMHCLSLVYWIITPLHVSDVSTAHHQEGECTYVENGTLVGGLEVYIPPRPADSQSRNTRITSAICHMYTLYPLLMGC
jgi:hypothetical protein